MKPGGRLSSCTARPSACSDPGRRGVLAVAMLDQIAEPLRVAARADAVRFDEAGYPSGVDGITVAIAI
jgi:hypothetical protein